MHTSSSGDPADNQASNNIAHSPSEDPGGQVSPTIGVPPYASDSSIEAIVEYYYPHIRRQAKRMAYLPGKLSGSADLHIDPNDIAQEVSISFWKRLQKGPIDNLEAYIRRMVHNKYVDAIRRYHVDIQPLPVAENGEPLEDGVLLSPGEGMADPAEEFEEQASVSDLTENVADAVSRLPSRQQRAAVRVLLKKVDNLLQVVEALEAHQVAIEALDSEDKVEKHRLQASFSPARLALAKELHVDPTLYFRRKRYSPPKTEDEVMP